MERPNILLIFPDQWRGDFLGSLGHKAKTPFLDQLAGEGMNYTSAYSATPSCIPARASMLTGMTGRSCERIGYMDGVPWKYPVTMQGCLHDAGYQTINVGKTHYFPRNANLGFEINRLYDPQNWLDGEKSDYHKWLEEETGGRVKDTADCFDNNGFCYIPWTYDNYLHPTEWTADTALKEMMERDKSRPFFMQVGFHRPHPPLDPPTDYYDMYRDTDFGPAPVGDWEPEKFRRKTASNSPMIGIKDEEDRQIAIRAYCAQLTHIDHQIGKLLYHIQRTDHLKNTIVIFSSDHGELLGDHCMWRKIFPYQGSVRIPLIIRTPENTIQTGNTTKGFRKDNTPVTHMDIMPTVLKAAGIEVPDNVEGVDILGPLRGESVEGREFIHGEHTCGDLFGTQYLTDGKYKYCYDTISGSEQLFNLESDPDELVNLAVKVKYGETLGRWRKRLIEIFEKRPEDGLVENGRLISKRELFPVGPDLARRSEAGEFHPAARKRIREHYGEEAFKKQDQR